MGLVRISKDCNGGEDIVWQDWFKPIAIAIDLGSCVCVCVCMHVFGYINTL